MFEYKYNMENYNKENNLNLFNDLKVLIQYQVYKLIEIQTF